MRLVFSLLYLMVFSISSWAQSASWTKSDRDNVFNDCMSFLGSNYKNLNNDHKETISLCFLDQITSKYTKESYQSRIEVELKRLRSAVINECSKTHGIQMDVPVEIPKVEETKQIKVNIDHPTKDNLVGIWKEKSEDREFELSKMGTFTMINEGKRSTGKWQLDGMKLTLYFDRLFGTKERVYDIEIFKEDNFGYTSAKGTFYNVVRVK